MKHLKRFNEATENFREELRDFCENNLAYLLDEGRLLIENSRDNLVRVQLNFDRDKDWDEIKDHIIPFFIRLTNKYEVVEKNTENVDIYIFCRCTTTNSTIEFKITDLIDDEVDISGIYEIRLFVQDKGIADEGQIEGPSKNGKGYAIPTQIDYKLRWLC